VEDALHNSMRREEEAQNASQGLKKACLVQIAKKYCHSKSKTSLGSGNSINMGKSLF
jgi:hypothetical protein